MFSIPIEPLVLLAFHFYHLIVRTIYVKWYIFTARCVYAQCTVQTKSQQLSVRLSVRHTLVLYRKGEMCHQTFSPSGSHAILVLLLNVMAILRR